VRLLLNLPGRGSISIHKQVQACYGGANQKPFFGLHGDKVEFEKIHVSKQMKSTDCPASVLHSFQKRVVNCDFNCRTPSKVFEMHFYKKHLPKKKPPVEQVAFPINQINHQTFTQLVNDISGTSCSVGLCDKYVIWHGSNKVVGIVLSIRPSLFLLEQHAFQCERLIILSLVRAAIEINGRRIVGNSCKLLSEVAEFLP
jgi:hypothetical protein